MDKRQALEDLSKKIWDYAEIKFEEEKSANAMIEFLKDNGFEIKRNLADIPTAFSATFGKGKPKIGLLAEFDALSGLSQVEDKNEPYRRSETNNGHGCGHHLLGVGSIGAALKVKEFLEKENKDGTIILYGTPGEEGGSGKAFMANRGVFNDLDCAITWHPFNTNGVFLGSFLANKQVIVRYHGISSHAAMAPQLGRSALDGLEMLNIGINFLREHMEDEERIHYAITNTGGISPNVVQNFAEGIYLIRSTSSEKVENLYKRFEKIVEGAALMTETKAEIIFDKSCSEIVTNSVLEEELYKSMLKFGPNEYTDEEIEYANKFRETFSEDDKRADVSIRMVEDVQWLLNELKTKSLCDFIVPFKHTEKSIPGSSDVGDVSRNTPTAQIITACYALGTPGHSWQEVAQGKSTIAFKGMHLASEVMADTIIKLFKDESIIQRAKDEFESKMEGKKRTTMPKDAMPLVLRK